MKKVVNIGGIFIKSQDKTSLMEWYKNNLGIDMQDFGAIIKYRDYEKPEIERYNLFSIFPKDTKYFNPSEQSYMINFTVEDLNQLVGQLSLDGIKLLGEIEESEYGKFAWVMDPDGNKIELWEPPAKSNLTD